MLPLTIQTKLNKIHQLCLVIDIETSAFYPNGNEINIRADFESYLQYAQVKWVGCFSYKNNKQYYLNAITQYQEIVNLLRSHDVIVGFNNQDFDWPILVNNGMTEMNKKYIQVDVMQIMGTATQRNRDGYKFKNRGELMGYEFSRNTLKCMAETMKLDFQKGDINYEIFHKNEWTEEETVEIKKYLSNDVMATKQIFDIIWNYWHPFAELIDEKFVYDLSWIRSSIASLTYKAACKILNTDPTYSDHASKKEDIGGNVYAPKYEESWGVWHVDIGSEYPHAVSMCNLPAEIKKDDIDKYEKIWHGGKLFKVLGYYDISKWHPISKYIAEKLEERIYLKEHDQDNPKIYALKIFLNCFSNDTQVLMGDNTIKYIKDCKVGEKVWSINPKSLLAEKKEIQKVYSYSYNGEMHHYIGNYMNFFVTPNHKFLLHKVHNNNNKCLPQNFYESKDIVGNFKIVSHKPHKKNYKKNINLLDFFQKDYFTYCIKSKTNHGRIWLNKYNLTNKNINYNANTREFWFNYDALKPNYKKIINNKDLNIYVYKKNRTCEHKKLFVYDNNNFSYLIGIYLSEGCIGKSNFKKYDNGNIRGDTYYVQLSQYNNVNPKIYNKIKNALDVCNINYSCDKKGFKICGSIFYDFIKNNFGQLGDKHFKNKKMFEQLNLHKVWEGLVDGDGHKKCHLYTTKSDLLKEDIIELCMRLGYTFSLKNDGCWRITYNKDKNVIRPQMRDIKNYNDSIYCLEIKDNHTLLAGRNNRFNWTGNSYYGASRSPIFEKIHTPNIGNDTCLLGQQFQKLIKEMMEGFGFEHISGDTDACDLIATKEEYNNKEYVQECLNLITEIIKDNVPFPVDTFKINVEHYFDYLLYPFSEQPIVEEEIRKQLNKKIIEGYKEEIVDKKKCIIRLEDNKIVKKGRSWTKERCGKKKNYLFIYSKNGEKKIKIVGLPIKKSNATPLGMKIFTEVLEPKILEQNRAKFSKQFIDETIQHYLKDENIMKSLAVEYRINKLETYKEYKECKDKSKYKPKQIQAQISYHYLDGNDGIISLIKNNKIGKVGKGSKYCSINEAISNNLSVDDLDLKKVYNELNPFILYEKKT